MNQSVSTMEPSKSINTWHNYSSFIFATGLYQKEKDHLVNSG